MHWGYGRPLHFSSPSLSWRTAQKTEGGPWGTGQTKKETGGSLEDPGLELNSQSWVKVCMPLREKLFGWEFLAIDTRNTEGRVVGSAERRGLWARHS